MNSSYDQSSATERLAQLVEEDIHRRGLRAGERYMTSEEAGKSFGVSRATVCHHLSLLSRLPTDFVAWLQPAPCQRPPTDACPPAVHLLA